MEWLLTKLKQLDIHIEVQGQDLKLNCPKDIDTTSILQDLKENKQELIQYINTVAADNQKTINENDWFDSQFFDHSTNRLLSTEKYLAPHQVRKEYLRYLVIGKYANNLLHHEILEDLDLESFKLAISSLVNRHRILSTIVIMENGEIYQKHIFEFTPDDFIRYHDVSQRREPEREVSEISNNYASHQFRFDQEPFWFVSITRVKENKYSLLLVINHIISDATTLNIVRNELNVLYDAICNHKIISLPTPIVQYDAYSEWISAFEKGIRGVKAKDFYSERINSSILQNNELETTLYAQSYKASLQKELQDFGIAEDGSFLNLCCGALVDIRKKKGGIYTNFIDERTTAALRDYAADKNTTIFKVLVAAFVILLSKLKKISSVRVYIPVSTRIHAELENVIGWLMGDTIVCINCNPDLPFERTLKEVEERINEASPYSLYPYEKIVSDLDKPLHLVAPFLFNYIKSSRPIIEDFEPFHSSNGSGHFDLSCTMTDFDNKICLKTNYYINSYSAESIEILFKQYFKLLEQTLSRS